MSSFLISSSTTSLWYRISFSAAIASSSGDLISVGPKTIPRFSAFIRFSFSWRVTLKNTSERSMTLCRPCSSSLCFCTKTKTRFTIKICACLSILPLGYFSILLTNFKVQIMLINNLNFWCSLKIKPELKCWMVWVQFH